MVVGLGLLLLYGAWKIRIKCLYQDSDTLAGGVRVSWSGVVIEQKVYLNETLNDTRMLRGFQV